MNYKKGQGMMEFLIIFGAMVFFVVLFLLAIQSATSEERSEREIALAQHLVLSVRSEISLAHESSEGYYREFYLPQTLLGKEYNITLADGWAYLSAESIGISYLVLPVEGTLQKGTNNLTKINGEVLLNM